VSVASCVGIAARSLVDRAGTGALLAEVFAAAEKERQILDGMDGPAAGAGFKRVRIKERIRRRAH
jgi:hypothetical protein